MRETRWNQVNRIKPLTLHSPNPSVHSLTSLHPLELLPVCCDPLCLLCVLMVSVHCAVTQAPRTCAGCNLRTDRTTHVRACHGTAQSGHPRRQTCTRALHPARRQRDVCTCLVDKTKSTARNCQKQLNRMTTNDPMHDISLWAGYHLYHFTLGGISQSGSRVCM